ncbi:MAG: isoleucine--tRNA ligase [Candidatus Aenigmatarchaeota archaeon]
MKSATTMDPSPKDMEERVSEFWRANGIYEKAKANRSRARAKKFFFLDGPPYATGSIHVGTAMNKVLKDFYIRFFRMRGFDVWDQPGYDTHGVPIENKVEKLLGFKSKSDIERYGVENFIRECKKFATEFVGVMGDQFRNLGVWMDWTKPYMTLDNEYIEGAWFTFKRAFEKGLLYRGTYSVHVCPKCETAVAYNEIVYKEVEDISVYVKFKVRGKGNEHLVVWTTTPWTLPSNTGVMANPKAEYARVDTGKDILIVSKQMLESLMKKFGVGKYKVLETFTGAKLEGMEYEHPLADEFDFQRGLKNGHRVVLSEQFVSLDEGTGLVHTAPGHGQEDYKVGKESGLPVVNPLNMDGTFGKGSGRYEGVFAKDADRMIVDELKRRGALLAEEKVKHDYPMCWRCESPLLMMAVPQWFFRVTEIRGKLLEENAKINWVPDWAGQRFRNWLDSLGDWPISRQRYWGIPLPIWVCENEKCDSIKVIGSAKELPKVPKDLHKPYIDRITIRCAKCGGTMHRVPDVLDVWFDSGAAPWASLGYPSNKQPFEKLWPVDFILEGPDQIRGWWNSLMINGVMTFGRRPFDNVLFHGFVLDAHGIKMSKSKGNVVTTEATIEKYGRDVLRFYYLSRNVWDDMYFKLDELEELAKKFMVVRNTFNFVRTYVTKVPKARPRTLKPEDRWILSRMNTVVANATDGCEKFVSQKAAAEILNFVTNDLSRWYVKLVRDRVWPEYEGKDKDAAMWTLFVATEAAARMLAPFCPYLAEDAYQNIIRPLKKGKTKESVHIEEWPTVDKRAMNAKLEKQMEIVKQLSESANAARQKAGLKLKWPVASVVVVSKNKDVTAAVKALNVTLKTICNAKKVVAAASKPKGEFAFVESAAGGVLVETKMDDALMREALIRELVRKVQDMRKKAGLKITDKIRLTLNADAKTNAFLKKQADALKKEVGAAKLAVGDTSGGHKDTLRFKAIAVDIAFDRA